MNNPHDQFHLEIHSLDTFRVFVAIIRGEDDAKVQKLIDALNTSTDALREAVAADGVVPQSN